MEIQGGSHNGDPSRFPQCVSALVGDLRPHPPLYAERCLAVAWKVHNGDPSWFTQWRSKLVHTMEIQAGSHNGDPSWFKPWRSKLIPTTEIQTGSQHTLRNGDWFPQRRSEPVPRRCPEGPQNIQEDGKHNGGEQW